MENNFEGFFSDDKELNEKQWRLTKQSALCYLGLAIFWSLLISGLIFLCGG